MHDYPPRPWARGAARYWLCQVAGWGGVFVLTMLVTIVSASVSAEEGHRWQRDVLFTAFSCLGGLTFTHGLRTVMVACCWMQLPAPVQVVRLVLAWSLGTALLCTSGWQLMQMMGARVSSPPLIAYVMMNGLLIGMWICIYVLYHMQEAWTLSKLRESQLRSSSVQAQMSALQAQLVPHFLFNALNVIRALVPSDAAPAREAITTLAALLRSILIDARERGIPLSQDLEIMRTYLKIERLRFDTSLQIEEQVSADAMGFHVPPLLCLTLAENSIKHGLQQSKDGGALRFSTALEGGRLVLRFDNPCGTASAHSVESLGIGLRNLRERIRLIHGEESSITLIPHLQEGRFSVTVCLEKPN